MNIHDEARYKWSEGNKTFQRDLNYLGFSMEIFHLLVSFLDPLACLELDPVSGSVPGNLKKNKSTHLCCVLLFLSRTRT